MNSREKKLISIFHDLNPDRQQSVLDFARFLSAEKTSPPVPVEMVDIPRPIEESVVGAIKRLTATYPMLDPDKLLNQTSSLMAQHVMQGRRASDIIDELEVRFREQYQLFQEEIPGRSTG